MRKYWCISAMAAVAALSSGEVLAKSTKSVSVDCSQPQQSVQSAVDSASPGNVTTVFILGECSEDVTIASPDIILDGDPNGLAITGGDGTINGQVTIAGAANVSIRYLTVTGPGHGVEVTDGASAEITGSVLEANERSGLVISNAAVARMTGTSVTGNGGPDGGGGPILNSTEPSSGSYGGVALFRNAVAELHCSNEISGNAGIEVQLEDGSVLHQECLPSTNTGGANFSTPDLIDGGDPAAGGAAMVVFNGSSIDLNAANVTGLSLVYGNSSLRAKASEITGDIQANTHGLVGFGGSVDFTGTLICDDTSDALGVLLGFGGIACGDASSDVPDIND